MKIKKIFIIMLVLAAFPFLIFCEEQGSSNLTHRMMNFVIQIGIIIFVAKFFNLLFEKFKLPGVLGELTSGIIIGPYLLGSIPFPGFSEGLFPAFQGFAVTPELYGLCTLASIVLLFMVGMETDIRLFLKYSVVGGMVGIFGVIFSFLGGNLLAVFLSGLISGKQLGFFSAEALFLGVISTATSVGITARILSEKKKMDTSEGVTILAGAVIDDVLGIIMLALALGILSASKSTGSIDWAHIGVIAAKTIGIWLFATVVGLLSSSKIGLFLKYFKNRTIIALLALGLALILAGLFEHAGLAMIIGAYIMGLSISRTDVANVIREKLHSIYDFLIPIFFCVMGMMVDFRSLASTNILIFGLIYSAVAIIAKLVGCSIPALFFNFNLRGALRIGTGMIPRGEVALIVAGIGLSYGFLPNHIFGVSIIMTLITTLLAPLMLIKIFNDKSGLRKEEKVQETKSIELDFPSPQVTDMIHDELLKVFEKEGFFVHLIDHEEHIYQLRKDASIIGLKKDENKIRIDCNSEEEEKFTYTAVYLVMGDIEQIIKGLQVPIDRKKIAKKLLFEKHSVKKDFDLSVYLKPSSIKLDLKGNNKEEILDELIALLCSSNKITDAKEISKAVWDRENSMSTGMQRGIAIPHGRTDIVDRLICAIGIKKEGIDFESLDGLSTKIFIITVSPKNAPAPHVQFMSSVSQSLTEDNQKLLFNASTKSEAYDLFIRK